MTAAFVSDRSRVYTIYDIDNPPPHPGPTWTRFVCVSDTHSMRYDVPPGDVLLHSGDLSSWGELPQLEKTLKWLQSLPHRNKIVIAGNHDLCLDRSWAEGGQMAKKIGGGISLQSFMAAQKLIRKSKGIQYLEYETMRFTTISGRDWEVYGSPAVPRYVLGAFQYEGHREAEQIHANIPASTEILLTHTPPHGICDETKRGANAGCPVLAARLASEDLSRCRLHVFGHIHEAYGADISSPDTDQERVSVNAAMPNAVVATIVDLLN